MLAVVDTGPLYAVVDEDDADHARCRALLESGAYNLIIPTMVIAEVTYLVGTRLGSVIEAQFLGSLTRMHVEAPTPDDWQRISELVKQYGDFPLGGTDASVVALAERLDIETVVTLDDRHFRAVRPRHRQSFRLLPSGELRPKHA
jgi:predicted nucleic acid-binding protein